MAVAKQHPGHTVLWLGCSVTTSKYKPSQAAGIEKCLILKQPRRDLDLCGHSFARYSEKRLTKFIELVL